MYAQFGTQSITNLDLSNIKEVFFYLVTLGSIVLMAMANSVLKKNIFICILGLEWENKYPLVQGVQEFIKNDMFWAWNKCPLIFCKVYQKLPFVRVNHKNWLNHDSSQYMYFWSLVQINKKPKKFVESIFSERG